MANSTTHALEFPIQNARFTIPVPYVDADGDPTDPTTPDTEFSLDAGAFGDCAEEVTTISGSNGVGYITLTGAETNGKMLAVVAKVASGPKNTIALLHPKNLPTLFSGTASAGAATTLTFPVGTYTPINLTGCWLRTTGGTGGGGTGGANNQARRILSYVPATRVATVNTWETTPDNTTTFDVLLPSGVTITQLVGGSIPPIAAGTVTSVSSDTAMVITNHASIRKGATIYIDGNTGIGQAAVISSNTSGTLALESPGFVVHPDNTSTYLVFAGVNLTAIPQDSSGRPVVIVEAYRTQDADIEMTGTGVLGDEVTAA